MSHPADPCRWSDLGVTSCVAEWYTKAFFSGCQRPPFVATASRAGRCMRGSADKLLPTWVLHGVTGGAQSVFAVIWKCGRYPKVFASELGLLCACS